MQIQSMGKSLLIVEFTCQRLCFLEPFFDLGVLLAPIGKLGQRGGAVEQARAQGFEFLFVG